MKTKEELRDNRAFEATFIDTTNGGCDEIKEVNIKKIDMSFPLLKEDLNFILDNYTDEDIKHLFIRQNMYPSKTLKH